MFAKSRALAVAVATAGVIGFGGAPMAGAAVGFGPGGNGDLLSVSNNQVPQACGHYYYGPANVLGAQAPVRDAGARLGIRSGDSSTTSNQDNICLKNGHRD
jgi:hypothetical protein